MDVPDWSAGPISGRGPGVWLTERPASASPGRTESTISEVMPLARMRERWYEAAGPRPSYLDEGSGGPENDFPNPEPR
jgi:hypothetical protein